jgi:ubiquinone/menaquinone biosynthesis C-methylase UbiE
MSTFNKVSEQYQEKSLVQQAATGKLLALLSIGEQDDVLNVACGPGHISQRLKGITAGRVLGTDISAGMIAQDKAKYPAIDFRQLAAEALDYDQAFDVVLCNSSMQWFTGAAEAVKAMSAAWRSGGRMGVSCPATENCPPASKARLLRQERRRM